MIQKQLILPLTGEQLLQKTADPSFNRRAGNTKKQLILPLTVTMRLGNTKTADPSFNRRASNTKKLILPLTGEQVIQKQLIRSTSTVQYFFLNSYPFLNIVCSQSVSRHKQRKK